MGKEIVRELHGLAALPTGTDNRCLYRRSCVMLTEMNVSDTSPSPSMV